MVKLHFMIRRIISGLREMLGRAAAMALIGAILGAALLSSVEVCVTFILKDLMLLLQDHQAGVSPSREALLRFTILLIGSAILKWFATFSSNQFASYATETIIARLRLLVVLKMVSSETDTREKESKTITLINDTTVQLIQFFRSLIDVTVTGGVITALLLGMFVTAWRETLIISAALGILGGIHLIVLKSVHRQTRRIPQISQDISKSVLRIIQNRVLIRIFRTQNQESAIIERELCLSGNATLRAHSWIFAMSGANPAIGTIAIAVTLLVSFHYFDTSSARLISFLYLLVRMVGNSAGMHLSLGHLAAKFSHFELMLEFLATVSPQIKARANQTVRGIGFLGSLLAEGTPMSTRTEPRENIVAPLRLCPTIELLDLEFSHDEHTPVIRIPHLKINQGSHLGLIGKSGVGKSTLLLLICGILIPKKGKVLIDGLEPNEYLDRYPGSVGYLGPEAMLFEGSLRENLTYGSRRMKSDEDCFEALRATGIYQTITSKCGGLNTPIASIAGSLSTGERQRLALSRLLLLDPLLVILDEPTANLDAATEQLVVSTINKFMARRTVVLVSHRPIFDSSKVEIYNLETGSYISLPVESKKIANL